MKRLLTFLLLTTSLSFAQAKDTVLLSGFDPFGGVSVNNSWNIAQKVAAKLQSTRDVEVKTCLLPTSYARAIPALEKCLAEMSEKPTLVVSLGAGPCNVKWETRAHNKDHDYGPDNDGVSRKRQVIVPGAPNELGLRLNYGAMYCELNDAEKKLTWVSTDPEKFVCNNTAFRFSHAHPELLFGFVHVPGISCEKKNPGISERAADLVTKMIGIQLDVRATMTSILEWPSELNSVRLPAEKDQVKTWQRVNVDACEAEFLNRWRRDF